jgi:threonine aldolase
MIDLRSDTVTRPSPEMRQAIADAIVGDDVIDVDPTVDALEKLTAKLLGKERAIYMPSGSMTNQIAVRVHCKPGDEFICEEGCHIYNYEQAAFAQLSGVVARTVPGEMGVLRPEQLHGKIRPINEHMARTRLVTIENTHNRGGGRLQPYDDVVEICRWVHEHELKTHLDGARLMNAVVASGISAADWAQHFDTVSICFSKGLGAPVGSALAGSETDILEARRHRKAFGGGMRQAGIIAAGALYALEHNIERLAEDHDKARLIGQVASETDGLQLVGEQVDTNIVIFDVLPELGTAVDFVAELKRRDVLLLAIGPQTIRAVTHLDVTTADVQRACQVIAESAAGIHSR